MDIKTLTEWLFANGGPILRYRVAVDLMEGISSAEQQRLLRDALATPEMQRWLENLSRSRTIHGSQDTCAENPLSKLLDYGLNRQVPAFDERIQPLLNGQWKQWEDITLVPFLVRAGYIDHPRVAAYLTKRIGLLYETAQRGDFEFYLSPQEASKTPKPWRDKPIYRDEFGHVAGYALPTSYDFYALAYCPALPYIANLAEKLETIVAFLSDPRFQSTIGGYGWDRVKRRCYAAGRVFLACAAPARLVLFLELGARFAAARRSAWFQQGLAAIEQYRTPQGAYILPPALLKEQSNNHIYTGAHMGLGENRRLPNAMELESTFRMLSIHKRMQHR